MVPLLVLPSEQRLGCLCCIGAVLWDFWSYCRCSFLAYQQGRATCILVQSKLVCAFPGMLRFVVQSSKTWYGFPLLVNGIVFLQADELCSWALGDEEVVVR